MGSSDTEDPLSPAGRRVIVTGARGGIGSATAALLERLGATVAGRDVDDFDIRDREAVDAGVAAAPAEPGGCDPNVANARVADQRHRAGHFSGEGGSQDGHTQPTRPVPR